MGNRYGEWIHDVESFQFAVSEDNARGDNYAGSHALYQDVTVPVPTMMDGTSNTFMYAEKFQLPDGEYVLTAVQHHANEPSSAGEDSRGLWQINLEPGNGNIQKGGWISDVTYEASGGNAVAMETLTIAHEGLLLL